MPLVQGRGLMDKQQFANLAIAIKSAYPASKALEDNASMDFWYLMLKDIEYKVAENAVMEYICTNVYPPNIAEIRMLCLERVSRPSLTFDEAWGVVKRAMSTYGEGHPQEAFEMMDELTLSVVKNLGWSRLCQSENPTAVRTNFKEAYEAKVKAAQNSNLLPEFVAHNKALLQAQYVPAIEVKKGPNVEVKESSHDVSDNFTEEQIAERERMIEEVKRRILGG